MAGRCRQSWDFGAETLRIVKSGVLKGRNFGDSDFTVYEACSAWQEGEPAIVVVWLHGASCERTPLHNLQTMHRRLGRRVVFFVPLNPKAKAGWLSAWGVSFRRKDDKHDLGHVFGVMNTDFLTALCEKIKEVRDDVGARKVLLFGYSMGGFGAWQLAGFMPELFTAIVPIAGYALGTQEPWENIWAPQPRSTRVFERFLASYAWKWAMVPFILALHAECDQVSSFGDTASMVNAVRAAGGRAELTVVPRQHVRGSRGHDYYNYTLQADSSQDLLYSRLTPLLEVLPGARPKSRAKASAKWQPKAKARQQGVRKWWLK